MGAGGRALHQACSQLHAARAGRLEHPTFAAHVSLPHPSYVAPAPGFPFCFKMCGMGLALLLVLVTLAAAELSMRLLLRSAQLTGKRSYDELARHAYGRIGTQPVRCWQGGLWMVQHTMMLRQLPVTAS